ncbi:Short-chain collagen C4 [Holothuria leucospilota]|uniref:Short-chain collagen C4 n=1 Tax=Holothuria leucospilota TaxID=206669 RepID=A0A9Q1CFJ5_HOLLE|nr:Short-chain collagen C4 [Holothuria leucospilota]
MIQCATPPLRICLLRLERTLYSYTHLYLERFTLTYTRECVRYLKSKPSYFFSSVITNDGKIHSHPRGSRGAGSVFVRWGRTDCPAASDLLYSGIAGGSKHRDLPGGGANILCLPLDPSFVNPVDGVGSDRAFIFSVQYQITHFPAWEKHYFHDVTCAVCKATGRFSHVMIPAKQSCPSSEWTLEYRGYLMAERSHPVHHKSMFICMDQDPTPVPNSGNGWANGGFGILDLVEGKCSTSGGGLPCGTYPDGKEFTCAVCTL